MLETEVAPAGPLAHTLAVTLDRAAPVTVEYWTDGAPVLAVSSTSAAARHELLLARLRAGRTYRYRVVDAAARSAAGVEFATGAFQTTSLPDDLAAVTFVATGTPTALALLHLSDPPGFEGYAAVDGAGEVVWYHRTDGFPFGISRRANGNFVLLDEARGLVELTAAGEIVASLPQDTIDRQMHHDAITTPWNTVLFIAFDARPFEDRQLKGEAVWEWVPETGNAVRRWTSWDHLSPTVDRGPRFGAEWLHANALDVGPRGNVLVSVHFLNQVISIAPDWQGLEWRLGGVNATVTIPADEQFSGQHTASEVAPGRVVLFDNRFTLGGSSRAVEFEIAPGSAVASRRWSWEPSPANHSSAVSSARRMANGNTLVGFGMSTGLGGSTGPTEVYEVTSSGEVVWHLVVGNTRIMFRAEPLGSIAGERAVAAGVR